MPISPAIVRARRRMMIFSMSGSLVLLAIPVLLMGIGAFCSTRGYRLAFSIITGAAVFAVCGICALGSPIGAEEQRLAVIGAAADIVSYDDITMLNAPPAFVLMMKICSVFTHEPVVFPLVTAVIQSVLAAAAVFYRCSTPYAAGVVLTACFIPAFFAGSGAFTAALIAVFASKYIEERRFFRFFAVMLLAACFDAAAVIPVFFYILLFSEDALSTALKAFVTAGAVVVFPGIADGIFERFGGGRYSECRLSAVIAVLAFLTAAASAAMKPMLVARSKRNELLVSETVCAAFFAAASVFDGRLFGLALIMMMQSVIPVIPDAFDIGQRFTSLVFPAKKKTAARIFRIVCGVLTATVCAYLVLGGDLGAGRYDEALKAVISL